MLGKFTRYIIILIALFTLSACYINKDVNKDQMGIRLYKNKIQDCVPPGVYNGWHWFDDLSTISRQVITFSVEDPEVATGNNQAVGMKITIQAQRSDQCEDLKLLVTEWPTLLKDDALQSTITFTALEGLKNGVRSFPDVSALLNDRNGLANSIKDALQADASKYATKIINVTIENIAPNAAWLSSYQDKAQYEADTQKETTRQGLIKQQAANQQLEQQQREIVLKQQLEAEKAQTNVAVEIASRAGKEIAAKNTVYQTNQEAFILRKLELMKDIFSDKTVWFVPENTDLTLFMQQLSGQTSPQVIPVPQN